MNYPKFILLFSLLILMSRCNSQVPPNEVGVERTQIRAPNIIEKHTRGIDFTNLIREQEHCYVFLTTDWCGGGELYMNNDVLTNMNRINKESIPFFVAYIGDYNSLNIIPDSVRGEDAITIYYLEDVGGSNALFDRIAIRKFLKQIDPNLKFNSAVPLRIEFKNNQAIYLEKPFSKL